MRGRVFDLLLVAAVGTWAQLDVWAPQVTQPSSVVGSPPVLSGCWALSAGALVWRRSRPLVVTGVVVVFYVLVSLLYGTPGGLGAYLPFFVVAYSLPAYGSRRDIVIGVVLLLAGFIVGMLRDPAAVDTVGRLRFWVYLTPFVVTFLLGLFLRAPRQRAQHLQVLASELDERRRGEAAEAVATERARIARELHDVVAHSLSTMIVQATMGEAFIDDDPERARRALSTIGRTGREALAEMRRLLGLLRYGDAVTLAPQPGLSRLDELVETYRESGLDVTLGLTGDRTRVSAGLDLAAYRIVQEALTNSLKHADAGRADVRIACSPNAIEVEVTDDGRAGDAPQRQGHGLVGMAERVALYGGRLESGPMPDGGFRVHVRLPVDEAAS